MKDRQAVGAGAGGARRIREFYDRLYGELGPQGWWPARTRFEVIVGAILTQNTNWGNVERAIAAMRREKLLTPRALHEAPAALVATAIRPAGYFNIKAARLKSFTTRLFDAHAGSLARMFRLGTPDLRAELLGINGIGPETADSILLYAASRPEFVVDAYTSRVLSRHAVVEAGAGYEQVKKLFMENLPADTRTFNEYHALIVNVGKNFCRPRSPLCNGCPLEVFL